MRPEAMAAFMVMHITPTMTSRAFTKSLFSLCLKKQGEIFFWLQKKYLASVSEVLKPVELRSK